MSSSSLPASTSNDTSANKPGSARPGWGRGGEPGSAFRGLTKPRGGGRGGGRGGRGGRSSSNKGGPATRNDDPSSKANPDQSKPKPPPVNTNGSKLAPPPATQSSQSPNQSTVSTKSSTRSKPPPRKVLEQKGPASRKESSSTAGSKPPPIPTSAGSGRGGRRPKRPQSHNKAPSITVTNSVSTRKASISTDSSASRLRPIVPAKDIPPHLAPPDTPHFDIKHDIDALVERVRAVAMDNRPNTPGSHIDWAGEEDDSLPDLDDWGVTSTTNTDPGPQKPASAPADVEKATRIISPILENTLKPLPTILDVEATAQTKVVADVHVDTTPHAVVIDAQAKVEDTPTKQTIINGKVVESALSPGGQEPHAQEAPSPRLGEPSEPSPQAVSPNKASIHPSLPPKPASPLDLSSSRPSTTFNAEPMSSKDDTTSATRSQNPSPERSSIASPTSVSSAPTYTSYKSPPASTGGRGPFQPSHGRSHTVGRFKQSSSAQDIPGSGRPRRGEREDGGGQHARTQSSPPTGSGTAGYGTATRAPHATRPVLTGDAFARLAKSLGGTPFRERRTEPASVTVPASAKD